MQRAAIVAMREVGATISTKFAEQPQVEYWLGEKEQCNTRHRSTQAAVGESCHGVDAQPRITCGRWSPRRAVALPLLAPAASRRGWSPTSRRDAVITEGEHVVILARKQHSTHEAEEEFVECISDALGQRRERPRRALVEGVRGQDVPVVRALDGAVEHRGPVASARRDPASWTKSRHRRSLRRLARRVDGSRRERRRHHVRGRRRRRGLHGPRVVGRRLALRCDGLGHQGVESEGTIHADVKGRSVMPAIIIPLPFIARPQAARVPRAHGPAEAVPDVAAGLRRRVRSLG